MPGHDLTGTRALVTGATSGLGAAMASALVAAGASVVLTGRDRERAERAAAAAGRGAGPSAGGGGASRGAAFGVPLDVRDDASVQHAVDEAIGHLGGLDLVVANAGIGMRTVNPRFMTDPQPFWHVTPAGFADVLATKVTGTFLTARAVVPRMLKMGGGRLVVISMNESTMTRRGFTPYGPAGAGVEALAHIMAADLEGTGVTVNILLPGGGTATGMIPEDASDEVRARLLDPAVMGPPVVWLASAAAAGVHGRRIVATEFTEPA